MWSWLNVIWPYSSPVAQPSKGCSSSSAPPLRDVPSAHFFNHVDLHVLGPDTRVPVLQRGHHDGWVVGGLARPHGTDDAHIDLPDLVPGDEIRVDRLGARVGAEDHSAEPIELPPTRSGWLW